MAFQLSDTVDKEKVFLVKRSDVEERFDPNFYKPYSKKIGKLYEPVKLRDHALSIKHPPEYSRIYAENGVQLIRSQNVRPDGIDLSNSPMFLAKEVTENKENIYPEIGDVLVVRSGVNAGDTACVEVDLPNTIVGADTLLLRLKKSLLPKFIQTFFSLKIGEEIMQKYLTGATNKHISPYYIGKIKIPLPPLDIQKSIVSKANNAYAAKKQKEAQALQLLDSIDSYLLNELGIELPPEAESTISQRMFVRKFSKVSGGRFDAGFYAEEYVHHEEAIYKGTYKVSRLSGFITRIAYGASVNNEYKTTGIPLLRIKDLQPNEIHSENTVFLPESMRKELGKAFVSCGDFLISRSGSIGITAMVDEAHDGFAFGSFMIKFDILENEVSKPFVSYVLNSPLGKIYFKRNKIGAIQGNITIPVIKSCLIPLPPLEKQNKIADHIQAIRDQAKQLRAEAAAGLELAKREVEAMIVGEVNLIN